MYLLSETSVYIFDEHVVFYAFSIVCPIIGLKSSQTKFLE